VRRENGQTGLSDTPSSAGRAQDQPEMPELSGE